MQKRLICPKFVGRNVRQAPELLFVTRLGRPQYRCVISFNSVSFQLSEIVTVETM
jgi:hypothetical protein